VRYVSFNARIHKDNTVTGEMSYTDPDAAPDQTLTIADVYCDHRLNSEGEL
jgi:hypothetical protein